MNPSVRGARLAERLFRQLPPTLSGLLGAERVLGRITPELEWLTASPFGAFAGPQEEGAKAGSGPAAERSLPLPPPRREQPGPSPRPRLEASPLLPRVAPSATSLSSHASSDPPATAVLKLPSLKPPTPRRAGGEQSHRSTHGINDSSPKRGDRTEPAERSSAASRDTIIPPIISLRRGRSGLAGEVPAGALSPAARRLGTTPADPADRQSPSLALPPALETRDGVLQEARGAEAAVRSVLDRIATKTAAVLKQRAGESASAGPESEAAATIESVSAGLGIRSRLELPAPETFGSAGLPPSGALEAGHTAAMVALSATLPPEAAGALAWPAGTSTTASPEEGSAWVISVVADALREQARREGIDLS